ncbi:MAG: type I DNA topoisomerase [Acidobacteriota bacterium]
MTLRKGALVSFWPVPGIPTARRRARSPNQARLPHRPSSRRTLLVCDSQLAIRQGRTANLPPVRPIPNANSSNAKRPACRVCAGCKGEILVKKSKRGKYFYGCSEYRKCDTVFWDKPVAEACPQCNKPFLLKKFNAKKEETTKYCSDETCGYKAVNGELVVAKKAATKATTKRASKAKAAE